MQVVSQRFSLSALTTRSQGPARLVTVSAADSNGMRPLGATSTKPVATIPTSSSTAASTSASTTTVKPTYRVSLFDAMKFNGPAPELINGRLAMVGILMAALRESETGVTVLYQLQHISLGMCLGLAVWVYASLVPILKGVKQEAFGPFSPRAEITNGRAAMLGFAVLCALEYYAGEPFF